MCGRISLNSEHQNMKDCLYWITQDLSDVPDGDEWLSKREQDLLSGIHVSKRRNDWRLGRWTAKRAYSIYNIAVTVPSMRGIDVIAAEDGGPDIYIADNPAPVSISISHSHGHGLCVIAPADFPVGCDLEHVECGSADFFGDYFRQDEMLSWQRAPEAIKSIVGYLIWSAKESCLKVLREGLRRDTRSVRIDIDFKDLDRLWNTWTGRCMETSRQFWGWWHYGDSYVYTMASEQSSHSPRKLET